MVGMRIDNQIITIDKVICRHIAAASNDARGIASQDILSQLRNFVEHIMLKIYANNNDIVDEYKNIQDAIAYVEGRGEWKTLNRFHAFLQIVASHYTLDEESSERLMLKYYEYLLKIKKLVRDKLGLNILANLKDFPLNTDDTLQEYYEKIAAKIHTHRWPVSGPAGRFYIQKIKPFFSGNEIFYEITLTTATDNASKSNRIIAFTDIDISDNYAVTLTIENDVIEILGNTMPILIITGWRVDIRNCEYSNFASIVTGSKINVGTAEQKGLVQYLTRTGYNLVDIVTFSDQRFAEVTAEITAGARVTPFWNVIVKSRRIIRANEAGANLLRYLLFHMNNVVIKNQRAYTSNANLSDLYLENGCIPFDKMPFINSPKGHNPRLGDLFSCIPSKNRKHELLARIVRNNTEINGHLFTSLKELEKFPDITTLVQQYNQALWFGHMDASKLVIDNGHIFINGYKEDTCFIIRRIQELAQSGVRNYSNSVISWLESPNTGVDCDEKKNTLIHLFESSHVALIYGSAGTGKSTLINHLAQFFAAKDKLFLAQTNPAVDNLKRKVTASNCNYLTISKFIHRDYERVEYDILVIDECSTVSNNDMRAILTKAKFKLLVLVGDTYQISSIRFGNWFSVARAFVPATAVSELTKPYRTKENGLLTLWERVRNMDDTILEVIARNNYSVKLDASIFSPAESDEVILCLNYDGLYGINNINRFLQDNNPNPHIDWGIQCFKIGDPILFNDTTRFGSVIYNNMKGRIVAICILDAGLWTERIQFDIELEISLNEMDIWGNDLELLDETIDGHSVIRFCVNKTKSTDDDDDNSASDIIPFQVAYAVSIHKAQGLEYNSVKIVITDEVDELISHNIFYTAITRAQRKLKIYWTPEVEQKVLGTIAPVNINKDVNLLRKYLN